MGKQQWIYAKKGDEFKDIKEWYGRHNNLHDIVHEYCDASKSRYIKGDTDDPLNGAYLYMSMETLREVLLSIITGTMYMARNSYETSTDYDNSTVEDDIVAIQQAIRLKKDGWDIWHSCSY